MMNRGGLRQVFCAAVLVVLMPELARSAVSVGPDGWTSVTPSPDSRIVYVSSSRGNDSNNGLSSSTPKKTLAAGVALMRHGYPDQLLLKKGDSWNEALGQWKTSGRSAAEPQLIGTYGTGARPQLKTGHSGCIFTMGGGGSPPSIDYVAIIGIECWANGRDYTSSDYTGATPEPAGIVWKQPGTWFLVEDVAVRFYASGINLEAGQGTTIYNATVRRSIVVDSYATLSHSQGIFVNRYDGVVLEENVIDHNGWDDSREGTDADGAATVFNHDIYIQKTDTSAGLWNYHVTVRNNIIARASSHGIQLRPGGVLTGNLFIENPLSALVALNSLGVNNEVSDNVVMGSADINSSTPRGTAYALQGNGSAATIFHRNIAAHDPSSSMNSFGLNLDCTTLGACNNFDLSNNVWLDWTRGCPITTSGPNNNPRIDNNVFWDCTAAGTNVAGDNLAFPDGTRTVGTYNHLVLGGADSAAEFLTAARGQSKDNWRLSLTAPEVNAWIRSGLLPSSGVPSGVPDAPILLK